jgi:hypothetical protein
LGFIGLFTCCDREGRFRWQPKQLKLDIFPYDEIDMAQVLDVLAARDFIIKYQTNDKFYGCIPSWKNHQCINHREAVSALPAPENAQIILVNEFDVNHIPTENRRMKDASATGGARITSKPGHAQGEGKWKGNGSGKGTKHKPCRVSATSVGFFHGCA